MSIQPSTRRIIKPRFGSQVANFAGGTGERWKSGAYERGEGLLVIFVLGVKKAMI